MERVGPRVTTLTASRPEKIPAEASSPETEGQQPDAELPHHEPFDNTGSPTREVPISGGAVVDAIREEISEADYEDGEPGADGSLGPHSGYLLNSGFFNQPVAISKVCSAPTPTTGLARSEHSRIDGDSSLLEAVQPETSQLGGCCQKGVEASRKRNEGTAIQPTDGVTPVRDLGRIFRATQDERATGKALIALAIEHFDPHGCAVSDEDFAKIERQWESMEKLAERARAEQEASVDTDQFLSVIEDLDLNGKLPDNIYQALWPALHGILTERRLLEYEVFRYCRLLRDKGDSVMADAVAELLPDADGEKLGKA